MAYTDMPDVIYGSEEWSAAAVGNHLLVAVDDDYETTAANLYDCGGQEYSPPPVGEEDWRTKLWGRDRADINGRLERAGVPVRLWIFDQAPEVLDKIVATYPQVGYDTLVTATKATMPGGLLPLDTPLTDDIPAVAQPAGEAGFLPTTRADGPPGLAIRDTGLPEGWQTWHPNLEPGVETDDGDRPDPGGDDVSYGHGLFLCGLARRVAPHVRISSRRVLHQRMVDEAFLCAELAECTAKVINLSVGTVARADAAPPIGFAALGEVLAKNDQVLVAAAGNVDVGVGAELKSWPAALDGVIAVGAYDPYCDPPEQAAFSNHGPWVDVWAPGVRVKSSHVQNDEPPPGSSNGWSLWSGTSFAAPLVAAAIAERVQEYQGVHTAVETARRFLAELRPSGFADGKIFYPQIMDLVELTPRST